MKLNKVQENLVKSMVTAGSSKREAVEKVKGYASVKFVQTLACPLCKGTMRIVSLIENKQAKYCPKDKVCLPI